MFKYKYPFLQISVSLEQTQVLQMVIINRLAKQYQKSIQKGKKWSRTYLNALFLLNLTDFSPHWPEFMFKIKSQCQ